MGFIIGIQKQSLQTESATGVYNVLTNMVHRVNEQSEKRDVQDLLSKIELLKGVSKQGPNMWPVNWVANGDDLTDGAINRS